MKRALIFNACSMQKPQSGVMIEEAFELLRDGYEVHIAYCAGDLEACYCNPEGNCGICAVCRFCSGLLYRKLGGKCRLHPMFPGKRLHCADVFKYGSNAEIKALVYKGVYIGYGALSNYVSLTRDAAPEVTPLFKAYFDAELRGLCEHVDAAIALFDAIRPSVVSCFNGRKAEQRVFFDLAKMRGITYRSNELGVDATRSGVFTKLLFEDALPHDILLNTRLMDQVWAKGSETEEEKIRVGRSFFEKRASGEQLSWMDATFLDLQKAGALPEGFDPRKRNIVILNSSEDEFVSLGREFDAYQLFDSQYEGIVYILEALRGTDCQIYLRVHPNLKGLTFRHHTDLYDLPKKYGNVVVIPATSSVSTYALIKGAEKVVVFGSTTGVEAAYLGKPVVLLAGSFYYQLGVCHVPKTRSEAVAMIKSDLAPIDNPLPLLKYGYYLLRDYTRGRALTDVDIGYLHLKPSALYGKLGWYCRFQTLLGSVRLFGIIVSCAIRLARRYGGEKRIVPLPVGFRWF